MEESRVVMTSKNNQKRFAAVLYPGKVENPQKAIETLGGMHKISQALTNERSRLELKFHPSNIYNKPAFGDVQPAAGLLLKIKKKPAEKTGEAPVCEVEVVGCVDKIVKFQSLCDYQYLPVQKDPKSGKVEEIYEKIVPDGIPDPDWLSKDQPVFFPPAVFSRDNIQSNVFRSEQSGEGSSENLGIPLTRKKPASYIPFSLNDPVPTAPASSVAKLMTVKFVTDEQFQMVKKLFDKCPVWPKCALLYETGINPTKLKCILPAVGYYYTTGPWRTMWVRYDYDMRTDFTSRFYQTFDFRLRQALGVNDYVKIKRIVQRRNNRMKPLPSSKSEDREVPYPYYDEETFPRARQCLFRFLDLRYPKIQAMLEELPPPLPGTSCDEKRGWLPAGFDEEVRQILSESIVKLFRKMKFEENQMQDDYEDEVSDDDDEEDEDEQEQESVEAEDDVDMQGVISDFLKSEGGPSSA